MKYRGWIIFSILIISAVLIFTIYKVSTTKNTVITSGGGSETKSTNGIGDIVSNVFDFFK